MTSLARLLFLQKLFKSVWWYCVLCHSLYFVPKLGHGGNFLQNQLWLLSPTHPKCHPKKYNVIFHTLAGRNHMRGAKGYNLLHNPISNVRQSVFSENIVRLWRPPNQTQTSDKENIWGQLVVFFSIILSLFRNTCGQWKGTLRLNLGFWRRAADSINCDNIVYFLVFLAILIEVTFGLLCFW